MISGSSRSRTRIVTPPRMRRARMRRDSPSERSVSMSSPGPVLQQVDNEKAAKRDDQHRACENARASVVELLEPDNDQQRHDLGDAGHIAGNEDHRPIFADPPRESERLA